MFEQALTHYSEAVLPGRSSVVDRGGFSRLHPGERERDRARERERERYIYICM